jgi:prepilin signal peptidase PulO-like enzyme (type II secretory pathway)
MNCLGALLGSATSVACLWWSRAYVSAIQGVSRVPRSLTLVLVLVGTITGAMVGADRVSSPVALVVVTCLLVVQVPIDFLAQRLARMPTLVALLALFVSRLIEVVTSHGLRDVAAQLSTTMLLLVALGVMHWMSPQSLGWGDVLLAAPLAFAVSSTRLSAVAMWMFLASAMAAVHGLVAQWKSGKRYVPFGPYLLGAAWIVLVVSV